MPAKLCKLVSKRSALYHISEEEAWSLLFDLFRRLRRLLDRHELEGREIYN